MITYPVDVKNARFTTKLGGIVIRDRRWPREDGMQLEGKDPDQIILQEIRLPNPPFDPATQKLDTGNWVDDEANETATFSRAVVLLTQQELDEAADAQDRKDKKSLVAAAIPTLRTWAAQASAVTVTGANNNTVTQQLVDHAAIFYDRFADLLEALNIDQ